MFYDCRQPALVIGPAATNEKPNQADPSPKGSILKLLALGANLPFDGRAPAAALDRALERLEARGIGVAARSRWWRSPAFPAGAGPDYVNGAAELATDLAPLALLDALHGVEAELGRRRLGRWEARTCDLDLLAWGDLVLPDPAVQAAWRDLPPEAQGRRAPETLILPHPRMQDRGFVLAPLAEIAPRWRHPALGRSVAELLAALPPAELEGLRPIEGPRRGFPDAAG